MGLRLISLVERARTNFSERNERATVDRWMNVQIDIFRYRRAYTVHDTIERKKKKERESAWSNYECETSMILFSSGTCPSLA